jgi:hypothetical protein
MAVGPVQLIVLGFPHPDFHGEIIAELERLRESDTVPITHYLAHTGPVTPQELKGGEADVRCPPRRPPDQPPGQPPPIVGRPGDHPRDRRDERTSHDAIAPARV